MNKLCMKLKINILCVEYPGYGIYQDNDYNLFNSNQTVWWA
jgi:hypothetical protein